LDLVTYNRHLCGTLSTTGSSFLPQRPCKARNNTEKPCQNFWKNWTT
jgi:hypothetical protein